MRALDIDVRFLERDARAQPREPALAKRPDERDRGIRPHRHEEVGRSVQETKIARQHADDPVRDAVDDEILPERVLRTAEAPLPVPVRQHHRRYAVRPIVRRDECTAERRGDAERRQQLERHGEGSGFLRVARRRYARIPREPQRDGFERSVVVPIREVDRRGRREILHALLRKTMRQRHEPARIRERQRPDQDPVDDGEDCDRRA
jgi:hypothetical protein